MAAGTTSVVHFGEALRSERQRRSVSLEDISQTTKVTVRSLQALESDKFDQLPGGILSKGIVRSYVRCLGLDEGEWVSRFLDASGQRIEPDPVHDKGWAAFALNVSTTRKKSDITDLKLKWAGVAILLVLLAGFGWFVWGYVHRRMASVQAAPATQSSTSSMQAAIPAATTAAPATTLAAASAKKHRHSGHHHSVR